jgi:queuine/archaeosine tRNA-ribosyltransferase
MSTSLLAWLIGMRASIEDGTFFAFRDAWLARYYGHKK